MTPTRRSFVKTSIAAGAMGGIIGVSGSGALQSEHSIPLPTQRAKALMELFGLKYPIFEAPHGSATCPELATAVSNAGAIGALADLRSPELARNAVTKVRSATKGNFVVNFILQLTTDLTSLQAALDSGAPISSHELNAIAALVLVRGADFLSLFNEPQRDALAMLFLHLHGHGIDVAGIFWGLWLFPLGLPVYQSGFLPRILGVVLMVNCFAYPVNSFTSLVLPQYEAIVSRWMSPLQYGELVFVLWLLIRGAKPKPLADPAQPPAAA